MGSGMTNDLKRNGNVYEDIQNVAVHTHEIGNV